MFRKVTKVPVISSKNLRIIGEVEYRESWKDAIKRIIKQITSKKNKK